MILEGNHQWAERWLKEGEERGEERGRELGIRLGEERGRELGIRLGEEKTKRENAVRMLEKGMPVALIAECVDLPEEEVRRLASETRH